MDRWYGTDELRQSWYLLTIATDSVAAEQFITSCEIGEGNHDQLIGTEKLTADNPDEETELLQELSARLDERRYNDITLVTPEKETLSILRTRLFVCDEVEKPTLRGFRHVAIIDLLKKYFSEEWPNQVLNPTTGRQKGSKNPSVDTPSLEGMSTSVTRLWETRTAIGPLVPPDALQGTPL